MSLETRGADDAAAALPVEEEEESEEEELGDFFLRFCRPSPLPIKSIVVVVVVNNEESATPAVPLLPCEKDEEERQAKNAALTDGMVFVVDMLAGSMDPLEAMAHTAMKNRGKRPSVRKILVVFLPPLDDRLRVRFFGNKCWTSSSSP
jgi:hypothetical protein